MRSSFEHYNPHTIDSQFQWDGLRSSKFGRTKAFIPKRDTIDFGLDFPNQVTERGRVHYKQRRSEEKQFRTITKMVPQGSHWHPRESRKKVFKMSFTQNPERKQKSHQIHSFPLTQRPAGIRTFYNTEIRYRNNDEYSVEDRMQRKVKLDQKQLRRSFYAKQRESLLSSMFSS